MANTFRTSNEDVTECLYFPKRNSVAMQYPLNRIPIKNSLKCLINNFILKKPTPFLLSLDVTQRCNAKCSFCGFWRLRKPTPELSLVEIQKIFDSAYDLGCAISIITGGEPLLRKDLPTILEHAKKTGFSTFLLTNGYLLLERLHEFYRNMDVVSVSIDFPDSRHDKNRDLDGLLDRAVSGIRLAHDYGVTTNINCVITRKHSLEDVRKLLFLAKQLDSGITFSPMFITPSPYIHKAFLGRMSKKDENSLKLNDWNIVKSAANMLLFYKKHGFRKTIQNTDTYLRLIGERAGFTCFPFSLQLGVSSTGVVAAMCPLGLYEGYDLGNAAKQNLRDIWYSKRAEMLRNEFRNCKLAKSVGCYLLCVAEPSLPFCKPTALLDYVKRFV